MDKQNNKDECFEIGDYLVKLEYDEVRQAIIELTSLLNQEKGDSVNIPKRLIELREFAIFNYEYLNYHSIDEIMEIIDNIEKRGTHSVLKERELTPKEGLRLAKKSYNEFLVDYNKFKEKKIPSIVEYKTKKYNSAEKRLLATRVKDLDRIFYQRVEYLKEKLETIKLLGKEECANYLKDVRKYLFEDEQCKTTNGALRINLPMKGFHLFFNTKNSYISYFDFHHKNEDIVGITESIFSQAEIQKKLEKKRIMDELRNLEER